MVWGCSSAGEHFVDIEGVTGSIPVTPTISYKIFLKQSVSFGAFLLSGLHVLISSNIVFMSNSCRHSVDTASKVNSASALDTPPFCYLGRGRYA